MRRSSCVSGKIQYATVELAEDALIELWTRNDYAPNQGPVAAYKCEDCGFYHHTSKPPMSNKLADAIKSPKFKLEKEANRWRDKFK